MYSRIYMPSHRNCITQRLMEEILHERSPISQTKMRPLRTIAHAAGPRSPPIINVGPHAGEPSAMQDFFHSTGGFKFATTSPMLKIGVRRGRCYAFFNMLKHARSSCKILSINCTPACLFCDVIGCSACGAMCACMCVYDPSVSEPMRPCACFV